MTSANTYFEVTVCVSCLSCTLPGAVLQSGLLSGQHEVPWYELLTCPDSFCWHKHSHDPTAMAMQPCFPTALACFLQMLKPMTWLNQGVRESFQGYYTKIPLFSNFKIGIYSTRQRDMRVWRGGVGVISWMGCCLCHIGAQVFTPQVCYIQLYSLYILSLCVYISAV